MHLNWWTTVLLCNNNIVCICFNNQGYMSVFEFFSEFGFPKQHCAWLQIIESRFHIRVNECVQRHWPSFGWKRKQFIDSVKHFSGVHHRWKCESVCLNVITSHKFDAFKRNSSVCFIGLVVIRFHMNYHWTFHGLCYIAYI